MLNYKHLYYVREVAAAGSIARASERLHITPQTISGQISVFEEQLNTKLFRRKGRSLELTEAGEVTLRYADKIFQLGAELEDLLQQYPQDRVQLFRVGVSDLVPKTIVFRLLEPAMQMDRPIRIACTEGKLNDLLAELAVHRMELVVADSPMPPNMHVKGFSHELGSCSVSFFATTELAASLSGEFPACLDKAPFLLPSEGAAVRHKLMEWFKDRDIHPMIVGEFDDNALMKAFGSAGKGIFIVPSALENVMQEDENIKMIGRTDYVVERFFAISVERRITHPAVKAITEHAQAWLSYKIPAY